MEEWAKKECEIACKKENPNWKEGEFDYGCSCYKSAFKAYKSLLKDGHSGTSFGFAKNILIRLMEGKPLTPIKDTEDIWNLIYEDEDEKYYQCKRMSSLFKNIYSDGSITYKDIDRVTCIDKNNKNTYQFGLVERLIDKLYPITFPYYPIGSIKVYCEDFLFDKKNGDFDTVGIFYMVLPSGEKEEINKFYKESNKDFKEITYEEYCERKSKNNFNI